MEGIHQISEFTKAELRLAFSEEILINGNIKVFKDYKDSIMIEMTFSNEDYRKISPIDFLWVIEKVKEKYPDLEIDSNYYVDPPNGDKYL